MDNRTYTWGHQALLEVGSDSQQVYVGVSAEALAVKTWCDEKDDDYKLVDLAL